MGQQCSDADGDRLTIIGVSNAINGTVSFDTRAGEITFTPGVGYHGPASFEYTLSDGTTTDTGTVNLTINSGNNNSPVANNDSVNGTEDTPLVLTFVELLANDSDGDGDSLTITGVANASNGTVAIDTVAETITFTPDGDYYGPASFEYTLSDGATTDTGTVNLTIDPVNDAPVANDDIASTGEDTAKVFTVAELLSNDSDVDGDSFSITGVGNATNGTVVFDSVAGEITFTPVANYNGPASFDYTVSDGATTDTGTVNLTIDPVNDAPVANNDSVNGTEDTPLVLTFAELLANDSDVDGDSLTITSAANARNGVVVIDSVAETITFTPDAGYSGAASFDYTISDGATTDVATVALTIGATNDDPVASDDAGTTTEDTAKVFTVAELLANDSDADGDNLSITGVGNATNGTVVFDSGTGEITFTPDADYHGPASFEYTLSDGTTTDTGTVNLTIDPVNDAPVANNDSVNGTEDTPLVLTFAELLANDSDVDGDSLTITGVANASNGTVAIDTVAETITFTPNGDYHGPASFEYTLSDGTTTDTGTVNLTIDPVNDAPVANNDSVNGTEDTPLVLTFAELLANDSDVDGDSLTITGVANASNGVVVIDSVAETITFTPDAGYSGAASFDYTVNDGLDSNTGTVSLDILPVTTNTPPSLGNDVFEAVIDQPIEIGFAGLLSNDLDMDGDSLSITNVTTSGSGSVSVDYVGEKLIYTPGSGETQADIEYTVSDGTDSQTGSASINFSSGELLSSGDDSYTGNGSANWVVAGDGNDSLSGKGGADHLNGNNGADTLLGGGGSDTLRGGLGNDTLKGQNGSDSLYGNGGDDLLIGGKGNDHYFIDYGDGHDTINNTSNNFSTETDVIRFGDRIDYDELWFTKSGDHLLIDVVGSNDQVKVRNWYKADKFQVDEVQVAGATLHLNDVEQLVNAMAAFDVPDGVGAVIPDDTRQQLEPTLTSVWQAA